MFKLYKNPEKKITLYTTGRLEKWINLYIQDPLTTWKRVKKYFKKPKISFKIHKVTKISGYPYATYKRIGKILDIYIHDVQWKDKWDTSRFESSPYIWICLFRRLALSVQFNIFYQDEFGEDIDGNREYWEYVLDYLFYKDQKTLRCYSVWEGQSQLYKEVIYGNAEDGSDDKYKPYPWIIPTVAMSLNKEGIKQLKNELNPI